jgi:hypothetical protein
MPQNYSLSEITDISSTVAISLPFSNFTGGWFTTSKIKTLGVDFFCNVLCGVGIESMACVLEGAFDTTNPVLVFSSGVTANSGHVTYQGSVNNWVFPNGRVRWISQANSIASVAGSAQAVYFGKG